MYKLYWEKTKRGRRIKMSKKGFDFQLEVENVKEDKKFNNKEMIKEIQDIIDTTPFLIRNIGFYENSGNFAIEGQVVRNTKKEAEAEYTIFKGKILEVLKKYYKIIM